jgi:hypothetical protein
MHRFRDSWLIRTGLGIIGFWILVFLALCVVDLLGHHVEVWPTNLWMVFWFIVALFLILIGIGQTIVRRRSQLRGWRYTLLSFVNLRVLRG